MTQIDIHLMTRAIEHARYHRGDYRAMRVTLECGHLRLMSAIGTIQGIGSQTSCFVCPIESEGEVDGRTFQIHTSRLVVNVEETGVLHDEWSQRVREGLSVEGRRA